MDPILLEAKVCPYPGCDEQVFPRGSAHNKRFCSDEHRTGFHRLLDSKARGLVKTIAEPDGTGANLKAGLREFSELCDLLG
jgi:hypothetical protein